VSAEQGEHLAATTSERGFDHYPPIPSAYGGEVRVYESSAASGPHIWLKATAPANLNDPGGPTIEAPLHLTAENATKLAEQLLRLVATHYQGGGTRAGVPPCSNCGSDTYTCGGCGTQMEAS
jgi:hypothetical protein